ATKHGSPWGKGAAGVGAVGALLAKFKFVLLFVLTKAKLLLLGLTKGGTFLSMLLSAGLYWTIWGWKFAFGLVLSIYIHEMGHVQALQRYGIKATAPMFIPGFGAVTRPQRWIAVAVIAVLWSVTSEGLLVLLALAAAATAAFGRAAEEPDHTALLQYAFLVGVLSLMTRIAVPATGP